jgi:hypothetical protein
MFTRTDDNWKESNLQVFWGEIAPCDHIVQIYENDKVFMDTLEGFVGSGFLAGDSVVVIATGEHLGLLIGRLINQGFDISELISSDQFIPLEATVTLSKFMNNKYPDEDRFHQVVTGIIKRAQKNDRKVRAFGEMVAILWQQGHNGATVQLENLWNQLHGKNDFSLFCAYPKIGFTQNAAESIQKICACHSRVISGEAKPSTDIYYRSAV